MRLFVAIPIYELPKNSGWYNAIGDCNPYACGRMWFEVQYTAAKTEYIAGAMAEHIRKLIDAATDAAYEKGYQDATKEACDEIAKNYHPNI